MHARKLTLHTPSKRLPCNTQVARLHCSKTLSRPIDGATPPRHIPCRFVSKQQAGNAPQTAPTSITDPASASNTGTHVISSPAQAAAPKRINIPSAPKTARGTAVVVGAGPAGSTAAMYLAAVGYHVIVIERRPKPAPGSADRARTFMLALGERGLKALDTLGVEVPPEVGRPISGSVYAVNKGAKRFEDPFSPGSRVLGVDRQGFAGFLADQAAQRFPTAINFIWQAALVRIDLKEKLVVLRDEARDEGFVNLKYDLLIGADGTSSAVRQAMLAQLGPSEGMIVKQLTSPVADLEYKAFHDLPWNEAVTALLPRNKGNSGSVAAEQQQGMTFFAFSASDPAKPTPGSLGLYINDAGSWSGTLFQPAGVFAKLDGVAGHAAAIRQFLPDSIPDEWVNAMASQMAAWQKPGRINPMNVVSHLASPDLHTVLLGDAAHNVTPQMGQGCNSALEDAALLSKALTASNFDIPSALAAYQRKRTPEVHALQHMEEENAWVRRPAALNRDPLSKTLARVAWLSFYMLLPLARLLPGLKSYVHASMFQNIISTTTPYDKLHMAIYAAPVVLAGLLVGVLTGAKAAVGLLLKVLFGWA